MIEPDSIEVGGRVFCRLHHTPMVYDSNWAFSVIVNYPGIGRPSSQFPNAKWGHPATPEMAGYELVGVWHCPACEVARQQWLRDQK
jgi:hypothetical protein